MPKPMKKGSVMVLARRRWPSAASRLTLSAQPSPMSSGSSQDILPASPPGEAEQLQPSFPPTSTSGSDQL